MSLWKHYVATIDKAVENAQIDLSKNGITRFKITQELRIHGRGELVVRHCATARWKGKELKVVLEGEGPSTEYYTMSRAEDQAWRVVKNLSHDIWMQTYDRYANE